MVTKQIKATRSDKKLNNDEAAKKGFGGLHLYKPKPPVKNSKDNLKKHK